MDTGAYTHTHTTHSNSLRWVVTLTWAVVCVASMVFVSPCVCVCVTAVSVMGRRVSKGRHGDEWDFCFARQVQLPFCCLHAAFLLYHKLCMFDVSV